MSDSPKQATGLELELEGVSFTEKPVGQVEHSWKDPIEHLTDSGLQLVTLHSESAKWGVQYVRVGVCVCVCVCVCVYVYVCTW